MTDQLNSEDRAQIRARGGDIAEIEHQLELLRNPPPSLRVDRPCTVGDGIVRLEEASHEALIERFQRHSNRFSKFVPASGAASRMFAELHALASETSASSRSSHRLVQQLGRFPFAAELLSLTGGKTDLPTVVEAILAPQALGLSALPKALIPFHAYGDESRTAAVEHLYEAALHSGNVCKIHFTVSSEHESAFRQHLEDRRTVIQDAVSCQFALDFSTQSQASDTPAVDATGAILRDRQGRMVFRPGGHGSLLENIARSNADLVFVKNIDNIMPAHRQLLVARWKTILGGYLLFAEKRLRTLAETPNDDVENQRWRHECTTALRELGLAPPHASLSISEIRERLHRPLRVCGVVRNQGEPGGGPFWTRNHRGESLQIVETAQIDLSDPNQRSIVDEATHFNPVDLVCSLRNFQDEAYPLADFVDRQAVFIADKTHQGKAIRALERPGLWNGSMSDWNTIFVEVPVTTFAPVKTVFDLLGPDHQPPAAQTRAS